MLQKSKNNPVYTLDNFKKIATVFMCGFSVAASSNQLTPDGAANENIKETIKIYSSHLDDSPSSV